MLAQLARGGSRGLAVTRSPLLVRKGTDGSWSAPRVIDSGLQLDAVSCVSQRFCLAVDADGNALYLR
jgi:hypothetical protein